MSDLTNYETRQEDEVDFLEAVFSDFQDLRKNDTWKVHRPPEILLMLVPQKSMGGSVQGSRPISIQLHAKYSTDYPDTAPSLHLQEPQGLTPDQVKDLEKELVQLAKSKEGEVMMLELAQHVMAFLHKHDRPLVSLHQEMVIRQREEEEEKRRRLEAERLKFHMKEQEEHRRIEEEIKRKEAEIRDQEHLGMNSDDSGDQYSSQEESFVSSPIKPAILLSPSTSLPSPPPPLNVATGEKGEGGGQKMLLDSGLAVKSRKRRLRSRNIQVKRGKLLGESVSGGYSVHVGMDTESGDLLAVYEWSFQSAKKIDARRIKQVESIQQEFENFMSQGAHHPSLLQFLEMTASKPHASGNQFSVELVMEYVGGGNVSSFLRNPDSSTIEGNMLARYSKQLLEAVSCLHSRGIVHNNIRPSAVYFDSGGRIKLGGSNVIKRLSALHCTINAHTSRHPSLPVPATDDETAAMGVWPAGSVELKGGKKGDIFRLGMVLLCLAIGKLETNYPPTIPSNLPPLFRDFLAKCIDSNEQRRFPAHELLHHPFITPSPSTPPFASTSSLTTRHTQHQGTTKLTNPITQQGPMHFQRSDSIFGSSPQKPSFIGRSRLETEFEKLEVLGSGGFGDVIKVRHYLDARIYALKRIQTRSDSKIMHKITREVELLSQMNHENVVRYYNAWIETYSEEEYKRHSGTHLEDEEEGEEEEEEEEEEEGSSGSESFDIEQREYQEESSSNESFGSSSTSSSSSDDYHSANDVEEEEEEEEEEGVEFRDDVSRLLSLENTVVAAESKASRVGKGRKEETIQEKEEEEEEEEEDVFMDNFSTGSEESTSDEVRNVLGRMETEVMNLSISKFRRQTTESSDTVVFADSSRITPSKPPASNSNERERKRERKRTKSSGQVQFLYIQMEFCENQTLRQLIDCGELRAASDDKLWRLFREVVEGLEHIHSKGMIHRDLKPGNIFLNSSGHIKIGDFGLAILHKHPINKASILTSIAAVNLSDGETGLVGTAMYMAPELLKNQLKYTQKVDLYSVGIIFFEMCHPPSSTAMERHKMLISIRRPGIEFPASFDSTKFSNQEKVIRLLLSHSPHERPSSKQLLQSPLLPLKMEDEELREVVLRTLHSTNSTRFRHLIDELFAQGAFKVSEFSYFLDPQESKRRSHSHSTKNKVALQTVLLQQLVHGRLVSIFTHHGAVRFSPPLLSLKGPLFSELDHVAEMMDRSGAIVVLPSDHRIPFARYVCHQAGMTYLKRYCIAPVFRRSRVAGTHPRQHYECQFDIVSPAPGSSIADAEVMFVVSEIIAELPGLQDHQFCLWVNHTSLLSCALTYCSIPEEKHPDALTLLHKMLNGSLKVSDFAKKLAEKNIQLSPLAFKTLLKFVQCEVALDSREVWSLLDLLLKDRSTGVSSQAAQAWKEITNTVAIFRQFGAKEQVYLHCGLSFQHFNGIVFQFVDTSSSGGSTALKRSNRQSKRTSLAYGGRYDKLLGAFQKPGKSAGVPSVSVVGVTVTSDVLLGAAMTAHLEETFPVSKCSVLVCWLGRESLQKECLGLVRDLWSHGISAEVLYDCMEVEGLEDVQKFCRDYKIPHIVILGDKGLYFERKQVKLRILESSKVVEKVVSIWELVDFLQQKHHHVERSDSLEAKEQTRASQSSEGQSSGVPQVNITVVVNTKLSGHIKRKYHDQTLNKLLPLFQKFSMKQQLDVIVVDLKLDVLSSFSAEINKLMATNDSDFSFVARAVCERHSECNKKYILRICDAVQELLSNKIKKAAVVFLYSHLAEFCQVVCNSLDALNSP